MVKFLGHGEGGRAVIGLGLSRMNTVRLLAGKPIRVPLDAPPPDGLGVPFAVDIVICAGETEADIAAEIQHVFPEAKQRRT